MEWHTVKKVAVTLLFLISFRAFCADTKDHTPTPYADNEFPTWAHDLRRAELITLGALPFVTLDVTLAYSLGSFAIHGFDTNYFVNPFAKSTDEASFTQGEQIGLILTSLGICLGIGITDFIVHTVKRASLKKKLRTMQGGNIKIERIQHDSRYTKIKSRHNRKSKVWSKTVLNPNVSENPDDYIGWGDELTAIEAVNASPEVEVEIEK